MFVIQVVIKNLADFKFNFKLLKINNKLNNNNTSYLFWRCEKILVKYYLSVSAYLRKVC